MFLESGQNVDIAAMLDTITPMAWASSRKPSRMRLWKFSWMGAASAISDFHVLSSGPLGNLPRTSRWATSRNEVVSANCSMG